MARRRSRTDASRPLALGTRADGVGTGWTNEASGQGSAMDRQKWTGYEEGCELDSLTIEGLLRTNAVARRMAYRPAEDSNKEGHRLGGSVQGQPLDVLIGGKPTEKAEAPDPIAVWAQRFGVISKTVQAQAQAMAHGLSLWVLGVDDGATSDQPLVWANIRRLLWLRVAGRECVTVREWERDEASPRFEQPKIYQVNFPRSGRTALYHWTRVYAWEGVELSDQAKALDARGDNAGGSVFDLAWNALKNYGVSQELAVEAISRLTQAVWQNDNLARAVDGGDAAGAAQHYERLAYGGGPFGDYALAAGESYQIVGRPIAGLGETMDRFQAALVAHSPMPELVLLGAVPSSTGLGSESDGQIRAWYDSLRPGQSAIFSPALAWLYAIASRAINGPTGGIPILELAIGWPSLWQLTPKEAAEVRSLNAGSRSTDLGAQAVTPAEARTDTTLSDEYELAPMSVIEATQPEVAIEDLEVADDDEMPLGETPLALSAAQGIIGVKSNGGVRGFIGRTGVPLFNIGGSFRVFESHLRAAMRESRV